MARRIPTPATPLGRSCAVAQLAALCRPRRGKRRHRLAKALRRRLAPLRFLDEETIWEDHFSGKGEGCSFSNLLRKREHLTFLPLTKRMNIETSEVPGVGLNIDQRGRGPSNVQRCGRFLSAPHQKPEQKAPLQKQTRNLRRVMKDYVFLLNSFSCLNG